MQTKVVSGSFFDGGDVCFVVVVHFFGFFPPKQKYKKTLQICVQKKTHHLRAIHTLFLRIVSARNLLLSSERDTASGIYAHKEVRAL